MQPYSATFTVAIDVDAKAAKSDLIIASGDAKSPLAFIAPSGLDIAATTAKAFTGAALTSPIGTALNSTLFETTLTADSLNSVTITAAAGAPTGAAPTAFLLPAPGHFADAAGRASSTAAASFFQEGAGKYYVVVADLGGAAGYNFTLTNTAASAAQSLAEVEPNNTSATAQVATTFPFLLKAAKLAGAADEDWVKVTAPGAKKLHARTFAGDAKADTVLQIVAADGTTVLATSSDDNYHEDLTSTAALAAGTYFVKVTASDVAPPAAGAEKYLMWLNFE